MHLKATRINKIFFKFFKMESHQIIIQLNISQEILNPSVKHFSQKCENVKKKVVKKCWLFLCSLTSKDKLFLFLLLYSQENKSKE